MKKRSARKAAPSAPKKKRSEPAPGVGSETPAAEKVTAKPTHPVPGIVGIGASAGGLDAFMRLLHSIEPRTGLAYVLVQHLSPTHESLLPELLARAARIPVVHAGDGMAIEADHAYVIPPNTTMTVTDGHLRLVGRPKGQVPHLPIDAFLRSLAEVHGAGAIAVILSGAGSDGALGVEAIKQAGGITFAQDSASARHPSMPEAAFDTGAVDFVLAPEQIAVQLGKMGRYFAETGEHEPAASGAVGADQEVDRILKLLHRRTTVDFSQYRRGTVNRRILRRMLVNRQENRGDYIALLQANPDELDLLYQDLLIGVTSFFRDAEVFAELSSQVFPALLNARRADEPIRVWVPGCSGGEETYSLAIALLEFLDSVGSDAQIQIFGTDLSELAVARARSGIYPESIAERVSPERLRRFFVSDRGSYRIAKFVRDLCIFSRQNIARDPPFSHLDLISCRNVLIYFEPSLQRKIFPTFHYALKPQGMLLLGTAESPGAASELFEPISKRHKIYRRLDRSTELRDLEFVKNASLTLRNNALRAPKTQGAGRRPNRALDDVEVEVERALLNHFGHQGVVVNEDLEIVNFRGNTSPFLAHSSGAASLDVLRLARSELVMPLRIALTRAKAERSFVSERHVAPGSGSGGDRHLTIDVLPLPVVRDEKSLFLVLFREELLSAGHRERMTDDRRKSSARSKKQALEVQSLREELAASRAFVSGIIEQHEASVEELSAAGEEIQSSNEELQSTNEELETTKEEVQSTNEELSTLNDELRHRNRELGELAGDLANIFASTNIPIAIVGLDLRLRRFTPAASRVMKVISTDVGRPLSDVKLCFELPGLEKSIATAVDALAVSRHLIKHSDDGSMWALTIRPYKTVDRIVDGAVLVFTDGAAASEDRRMAMQVAEEARAEALKNYRDLMLNVELRERAEKERSELLIRLQSSQEEERRIISRELHDELGQHVTALGLGLHELSQIALPESEVGRRTARLRSLVDTLGQELHSIALRLRPKGLDDFGLEPALSSYAQGWSEKSGITLDFHMSNGVDRLPLSTESAVYRIAQEALNNIAKHSTATLASIVIERRDGTLHVTVEDNGIGFDGSVLDRSVSDAGGLGLLGIRERVALLGGTFVIESIPGQGATLYIRIPVNGHGTGHPGRSSKSLDSRNGKTTSD